MSLQATVTRVESVPSTADICHFDELSEKAKDGLFQLVDNELSGSVTPDIASELAQYDIVKFTEYYQISFTKPATSGSVSV
jgi:hypothetical protein